MDPNNPNRPGGYNPIGPVNPNTTQNTPATPGAPSSVPAQTHVQQNPGPHAPSTPIHNRSASQPIPEQFHAPLQSIDLAGSGNQLLDLIQKGNLGNEFKIVFVPADPNSPEIDVDPAGDEYYNNPEIQSLYENARGIIQQKHDNIAFGLCQDIDTARESIAQQLPAFPPDSNNQQAYGFLYNQVANPFCRPTDVPLDYLLSLANRTMPYGAQGSAMPMGDPYGMQPMYEPQAPVMYPQPPMIPPQIPAHPSGSLYARPLVNAGMGGMANAGGITGYQPIQPAPVNHHGHAVPSTTGAIPQQHIEQHANPTININYPPTHREGPQGKTQDNGQIVTDRGLVDEQYDEISEHTLPPQRPVKPRSRAGVDRVSLDAFLDRYDRSETPLTMKDMSRLNRLLNGLRDKLPDDQFSQLQDRIDELTDHLDTPSRQNRRGSRDRNVSTLNINALEKLLDAWRSRPQGASPDELDVAERMLNLFRENLPPHRISDLEDRINGFRRGNRETGRGSGKRYRDDDEYDDRVIGRARYDDRDLEDPEGRRVLRRRNERTGDFDDDGTTRRKRTRSTSRLDERDDIKRQKTPNQEDKEYLNKLEAEIKKLRSKIGDMDSDDFLDELEELENNINDSEDRGLSKVNDRTAKRLRRDIESLRNEVDEKEHEDDIADLHKQINQKAKELRNAKSKKDKERLKRELNNLIEDLNEHDFEDSGDSSRLIKKIKQQIKELDEDNTVDETDNTESIEKNKKALAQGSSKIGILKKSIEAEDPDLDKIESDLKEAKKHVKALTKLNDLTPPQNRQKKRLESELKSLTEQAETVQEDVEKATDDAEKAKKALKTATSHVNALREIVEADEPDLTQIEKDLETATNSVGTLKKLKTLTSAQKKQKTDLEEELEELTSQAETVQEGVEKAADDAEKAKKALKTATSHVSALRESVEAEEPEVEEIKTDLETATNSVGTLKQLKNLTSAQKKQKTDLEEELEELTSQAETVQEDVEKSADDAEKAKKALKTATSHVNALRESVKADEPDLTQIEKDLETATNSVGTLKQLKNLTPAQKKQQKDLEEGLEQLTVQVTTVKKGIKIAKDSLEKASADLSTLKGSVENEEPEVDQIEGDLEKATLSVNALQSLKGMTLTQNTEKNKLKNSLETLTDQAQTVISNTNLANTLKQEFEKFQTDLVSAIEDNNEDEINRLLPLLESTAIQFEKKLPRRQTDINTLNDTLRLIKNKITTQRAEHANAKERKELLTSQIKELIKVLVGSIKNLNIEQAEKILSEINLTIDKLEHDPDKSNKEAGKELRLNYKELSGKVALLKSRKAGFDKTIKDHFSNLNSEGIACGGNRDALSDLLLKINRIPSELTKGMTEEEKSTYKQTIEDNTTSLIDAINAMLEDSATPESGKYEILFKGGEVTLNELEKPEQPVSTKTITIEGCTVNETEYKVGDQLPSIGEMETLKNNVSKIRGAHGIDNFTQLSHQAIDAAKKLKEEWEEETYTEATRPKYGHNLNDDICEPSGVIERKKQSEKDKEYIQKIIKLGDDWAEKALHKVDQETLATDSALQEKVQEQTKNIMETFKNLQRGIGARLVSRQYATDWIQKEVDIHRDTTFNSKETPLKLLPIVEEKFKTDSKDAKFLHIDVAVKAIKSNNQKDLKGNYTALYKSVIELSEETINSHTTLEGEDIVKDARGQKNYECTLATVLAIKEQAKSDIASLPEEGAERAAAAMQSNQKCREMISSLQEVVTEHKSSLLSSTFEDIQAVIEDGKNEINDLYNDSYPPQSIHGYISEPNKEQFEALEAELKKDDAGRAQIADFRKLLANSELARGFASTLARLDEKHAGIFNPDYNYHKDSKTAWVSFCEEFGIYNISFPHALYAAAEDTLSFDSKLAPAEESRHLSSTTKIGKPRREKLLEKKLVPFLCSEKFAPESTDNAKLEELITHESNTDNIVRCYESEILTRLESVYSKNTSLISSDSFKFAKKWVELELSAHDDDDDDDDDDKKLDPMLTLSRAINIMGKKAKEDLFSKSIYRGLPTDSEGNQVKYHHQDVIDSIKDPSGKKLLTTEDSYKKGSDSTLFRINSKSLGMINTFIGDASCELEMFTRTEKEILRFPNEKLLMSRDNKNQPYTLNIEGKDLILDAAFIRENKNYKVKFEKKNGTGKLERDWLPLHDRNTRRNYILVKDQSQTPKDNYLFEIDENGLLRSAESDPERRFRSTLLGCCAYYSPEDNNEFESLYHQCWEAYQEWKGGEPDDIFDEFKKELTSSSSNCKRAWNCIKQQKIKEFEQPPAERFHTYSLKNVKGFSNFYEGKHNQRLVIKDYISANIKALKQGNVGLKLTPAHVEGTEFYKKAQHHQTTDLAIDAIGSVLEESYKSHTPEEVAGEIAERRRKEFESYKKMRHVDLVSYSECEIDPNGSQKDLDKNISVMRQVLIKTENHKNELILQRDRYKEKLKDYLELSGYMQDGINTTQIEHAIKKFENFEVPEGLTQEQQEEYAQSVFGFLLSSHELALNTKLMDEKQSLLSKMETIDLSSRDKQKVKYSKDIQRLNLNIAKCSKYEEDINQSIEYYLSGELNPEKMARLLFESTRKTNLRKWQVSELEKNYREVLEKVKSNEPFSVFTHQPPGAGKSTGLEMLTYITCKECSDIQNKTGKLKKVFVIAPPNNLPDLKKGLSEFYFNRGMRFQHIDTSAIDFDFDFDKPKKIYEDIYNNDGPIGLSSTDLAAIILKRREFQRKQEEKGHGNDQELDQKLHYYDSIFNLIAIDGVNFLDELDSITQPMTDSSVDLLCESINRTVKGNYKKDEISQALCETIASMQQRHGMSATTGSSLGELVITGADRPENIDKHLRAADVTSAGIHLEQILKMKPVFFKSDKTTEVDIMKAGISAWGACAKAQGKHRVDINFVNAGKADNDAHYIYELSKALDKATEQKKELIYYDNKTKKEIKYDDKDPKHKVFEPTRGVCGSEMSKDEIAYWKNTQGRSSHTFLNAGDTIGRDPMQHIDKIGIITEDMGQSTNLHTQTTGRFNRKSDDRNLQDAYSLVNLKTISGKIKNVETKNKFENSINNYQKILKEANTFKESLSHEKQALFDNIIGDIDSSNLELSVEESETIQQTHELAVRKKIEEMINVYKNKLSDLPEDEIVLAEKHLKDLMAACYERDFNYKLAMIDTMVRNEISERTISQECSLVKAATKGIVDAAYSMEHMNYTRNSPAIINQVLDNLSESDITTLGGDEVKGALRTKLRETAAKVPIRQNHSQVDFDAIDSRVGSQPFIDSINNTFSEVSAKTFFTKTDPDAVNRIDVANNKAVNKAKLVKSYLLYDLSSMIEVIQDNSSSINKSTEASALLNKLIAIKKRLSSELETSHDLEKHTLEIQKAIDTLFRAMENAHLATGDSTYGTRTDNITRVIERVLNKYSVVSTPNDQMCKVTQVPGSSNPPTLRLHLKLNMEHTTERRDSVNKPILHNVKELTENGNNPLAYFFQACHELSERKAEERVANSDDRTRLIMIDSIIKATKNELMQASKDYEGLGLSRFTGESKRILRQQIDYSQDQERTKEAIGLINPDKKREETPMDTSTKPSSLTGRTRRKTGATPASSTGKTKISSSKSTGRPPSRRGRKK